MVIDEDECAVELHDCDDNATCANTIGGYNCTCNPGFHQFQDGKACIKNGEGYVFPQII